MISYLVCDLFIEVYLVACYGILHCYYVDLKLSEKNGGVPRNAPKELKTFLITKKTEYKAVAVDDSFDSAKAKEDAKEYK